MAIAHVQSATNRTGSNVSSLSKAFASNVTLGNLIVVCAGTRSNALPSGGCSDSLGNTYSQAVVSSNSQGSYTRYAAIYYAVVTAAGACTVTVTPSADGQIVMSISEFSGCAGSSPLDVTNSGTGNSAAPSSGSVSPNGSDLLVGAMTFDGSPSSITSDSDYTEIYAYGSASPYMGSQYRLNRSSSDAADWTLQYTRQWVAVIAAFKPSGTAHAVSASDGVKGGETNSTACTFAGSVTDGLTGGETMAPACGYPMSASDVLVCSDLASVALAIAVSAVDGARIPESLSARYDFGPAVFDGLTLAEAFSAACALMADASDGLRSGDVCGPGNLFAVAASDGLSAGDSLSTALAYAASVNAGIKAGELASAACRFEVAVSDISRFAEALAAVYGFAVTVTDGGKFGDVAVCPLAGHGAVRITVSASRRTFAFTVRPKTFNFSAN